MKKLSILILCIMMFGCTPNKIFSGQNINQLEADEYLKMLQNSESYNLIDVRTPMEYKKNHLEGAINISYIGFGFGKKAAKLDPSKTTFIYCQSAHRSPYAAKKLKKKGFRDIVDLQGGFKTIREKI